MEIHIASHRTENTKGEIVMVHEYKKKINTTTMRSTLRSFVPSERSTFRTDDGLNVVVVIPQTTLRTFRVVETGEVLTEKGDTTHSM
jgi:hypothetical protein